MTKPKPNYKIVKKFYFSGERYFVYKRRAWIPWTWKRVEICRDQGEAERYVNCELKLDAMKAKKPEVIGYY